MPSGVISAANSSSLPDAPDSGSFVSTALNPDAVSAAVTISGSWAGQLEVWAIGPVLCTKLTPRIYNAVTGAYVALTSGMTGAFVIEDLPKGATIALVAKTLTSGTITITFSGIVSTIQSRGHGGWNVVGHFNSNNGQNFVPNDWSYWTPASGTSRRRFVCARACTSIRLVFLNVVGNNPETYAGETVTIKASVAKRGTSDTDQTPFRWPVFFNGKRTVSIPCGAMIFSDPIPMGLAAGEAAFVYTYQLPTTKYAFSTGWYAWQANNGEGYDMSVDYTDGASESTLVYPTGHDNAGAYGPIAVQGLLADPSMAIPAAIEIADSIGTGHDWVTSLDDGNGPIGGRLGLIGRSLANLPHLNYYFSGSSLATIFDNTHNLGLFQVLSLYDVVCLWHGGNGSITLADAKNYILLFAERVLKAGKKLIVKTVLPRATSSDNFATISNQTIAVTLIRLCLNDWIVDPSANGFLAQVRALVPGGAVSVLDVAGAIEVNRASVVIPSGTRLTPIAGHASSTVVFASAHGFTSGDVVSPLATVSGALTVATNYYVGAYDTDHSTPSTTKCSFYDTKAHAISGGATGLVTLTADPGTLIKGGGYWPPAGTAGDITGTATSAAASPASLTKTGAFGAVNAQQGKYLFITGGTGVDTTAYRIVSNTADTVTVVQGVGNGDWSSGTPDETSTFLIRDIPSYDGTHPTAKIYAQLTAMNQAALRAMGCPV